MQPLISYLMGEKHPGGFRLANSQKSFRAEDIDEVGNGRHTTFFEMLGNWSFGDYFKKEQLFWIYEFLIEELGLDIKRLYATVFRGNKDIGVSRDMDSVGYLKEIFSSYGVKAKDIDFSEKNGMQDGRIFYYPEQKNWWSRSGTPDKMPVGEIGGPDSEIFYDLGKDLKLHENSIFRDILCHVNCDCGRFIEIGNSVFMEFKRTEKGFENLKQHNVDFGGGLERITMICQGLKNIFETDLFINIIKKIEKISGKKYYDYNRPFEIIADHMRAATFIMGDNKGVCPSNTGQGYIVRRLIRRSIKYGRSLDIMTQFWTNDIAEIIIKDYFDIYPELENNKKFILDQLRSEEEKFNKTLEKGLREFEKLNVRKKISGHDAFNLFQTYGFPIEMTVELAAEKGLSVDTEGFRRELAKHQELSRTASAGVFKGGLADTGIETTRLHTAAHLMLSALRKVLGENVYQKGSNITAERLRFDFSYKEKMTQTQIKQVEDIVNDLIQKDLEITCKNMNIEKARQIGAIGVFESKYEENVKVYSIGNGSNVVSREICGGPHIKRTGELGYFKILKEESSGAGVRRIKAILEHEK
jgi:alanyl-tRNA synthetase